MKRGWTLAGLSLAVTLLAAPLGAQPVVPTPAQAMSFDLARDPLAWSIGGNTLDPDGFSMVLLPAGEQLDHWSERVEQQVRLTRVPLAEYVEQWQTELRSTRPDIGLRVMQLEDGSFSALADSGDALTLHRFIQGRDGIYSLSHAVHPGKADPRRWKTWVEVILKAHLVDNPQAAAAATSMNPVRRP